MTIKYLILAAIACMLSPTATAGEGKITADSTTYKMSYTLPEVTVAPKKKDILHILGYVREYSTLTSYTDTVILFREKMVDFMIPGKKAKRFNGWTSPRLLKSRSYYRFATASGLDSVSNYYRQHFSWADWIGIPNPINIPSKLQTECLDSDTIHGKYGPASIWCRTGDDISVDVDILADTANRIWVPGLKAFMHGNVDFNRFEIHYTFNDISTPYLPAENITGITYNIDSNGRGWGLFQVFRKDEPYSVNTYAEIYIADREYLTKKQARRWDNINNIIDEIDIIPPHDAPPLSADISDIVARVNAINHDSQRTTMKPDEKLIRTIPKMKEKNVLGKMLKGMLK